MGARIRSDFLPTTTLAIAAEARELALHGGDDYELLFTVKRQKVSRISGEFQRLRLTRIGEITREKRIVLEIAAGRVVPLVPGGWDPFRT